MTKSFNIFLFKNKTATSVLNLLIYILIISFSFETEARGASSALYSSERITAQLITAENGVNLKTRTISAALIISLNDGWKTYWKSPGEVGYPPTIDWSDSENILNAKFYWPTPKRFSAFGIENYGYLNEVTFPISILQKKMDKSFTIEAEISLLVCEELCVPENFHLSLNLPKGEELDKVSQNRILSAFSTLPLDGENEDFTLSESYIDKVKNELVVKIISQKPIKSINVFPDAGPETAFGPPIEEFNNDRKVAIITLPILTTEMVKNELRLTISNGILASDFKPTLSSVRPIFEEGPKSQTQNLLVLIIFGALGGIILNIMPCVLPVLFLKVNYVLKSQKIDSRSFRLSFLTTSLGTVFFMWMLFIIITAVKAAGGQVGWGIQFQSPIFLSFIILVLIFFSLNLLGFLKIILPQNVNTRVSNLSLKTGLIGDFLTGAFSALLATPCSAPFLGTAITFALTTNTFEAFLIFTSIGVGLSSPYLILAVSPKLFQFLPSPGNWMIVTQRIMGLLLAITVLWFLWVLSNVQNIWAILIFIALIFMSILAFKIRAPKQISYLIFLSCIGFALFNSVIFQFNPDPIEKQSYSWHEFNPDEIQFHVNSGKVVFIDITAEWCLTCKANKILVLNSSKIIKALSAENVIKMRGDWTQQNPKILKFLQSHDRFAIPFNIIYGPNSKKGVILKEILNSDQLLKALSISG